MCSNLLEDTVKIESAYGKIFTVSNTCTLSNSKIHTYALPALNINFRQGMREVIG